MVTRHPLALVLLAAAGCHALALGQAVLAQRGQFDKNPVNPADEAYIFTPRGFDREGKPAVATGPRTARLSVTIIDRATGDPTFCRVNVVGADGNYYQPQDNPLIAYSLTGTWPERPAGNRPSKAPIRYFGRFFYTSGAFTVEVPAGPTRVEVWKGFEYRPATRSIDLAPGATGACQATAGPAAASAPSRPRRKRAGSLRRACAASKS